MFIYFIRHGQSYVNLPDWPGGNTDTGLTELGKQQAAALAAYMPQHVPHIDGLYASTMMRAKETAQMLAAAYGSEIHFDDRLREVGNNRMDHSPWPNDALPNQYADFWGSARPFSPLVTDVEQGETWMHFRTRVGLFIEEIVERHYRTPSVVAQGERRESNVVAVCHGGVIEAAFHHIYNIGHRPMCEVWSHNTAVTRFQYVAHPGRESWRMRDHNRIDHLVGVEESAFF
ncbi:MAG: histidine phosphatase family protein [Caldilineaceae bacterium]